MLKYIENTLTSVYFGPQGFQLFKTENEQKTSQDKFTGDKSWNKNWFVVGVDTELGDPYFINKNSEDAFVYTAIFDGNSWSLITVAYSIQSFIECLTFIQKVSSQTSEVYVPDKSTVTDGIILNGLEAKLIKTSQCNEFWQQFFVCYKDWLEEE